MPRKIYKYKQYNKVILLLSFMMLRNKFTVGVCYVFEGKMSQFFPIQMV